MSSEYDGYEIEEINMNILPAGFIRCEHVKPLEHQRTGWQDVNICSHCGSIGGDNFPEPVGAAIDQHKHLDECHFCGGTVTREADKARWIPKYDNIPGKRSLLGKRTTVRKEVGGHWELLKK